MYTYNTAPSPEQLLQPIADCSTRVLSYLHHPTKVPIPSKPCSICDQIVSLSRKALEQRKKAEVEEERWRERQKQREKKLQRVVLKRAQANDPHLALTQTHQTKLKEFRCPRNSVTTA